MFNIGCELDNILLTSPVVASGVVGGAFQLMECSSYKVVSGCGWLGSRTAMVIGIAAGLVLITYQLAKTVLAKMLNATTFCYFDCLNRFEQFCERRLNISLVVVPVFPLLILSTVSLIKTGYKAYQTFQNVQEFWNTLSLNANDIIEHVRNLEFQKAIDKLQEAFPRQELEMQEINNQLNVDLEEDL